MSTCPPEFVSQVKDALSYLYDPAHLASHPLVQILLPSELSPEVGASRALREVLVNAIDQLDYSTDLRSDSRQQRLHQILSMRYVEALPYRTVATELGLSQTQYHRDHRQALGALSILLWESTVSWKSTDLPATSPAATAIAASGAEVPVGAGSGGTIDLGETLQGVVELLASIAPDRRVLLENVTPASRVSIRGDRTPIRQLIISLATWMISGAESGCLQFGAQQDGRSARLDLRYRGEYRANNLTCKDAEERLSLARKLALTQEASLEFSNEAGRIDAAIRFGARQSKILIIDDNPDIAQLVARFLGDKELAVLSARSVRDGLARARDIGPDVILLDVMMPEQDGWDALQALKHNPETRSIPVLVCTVLGESELAMALGADGFIKKPVSRPKLLEALTPWLDPELPPGEAAPTSRAPFAAGC